MAARANSDINKQSHLEIKGTPTRHHEQPFEDREEAVGERDRGALAKSKKFLLNLFYLIQLNSLLSTPSPLRKVKFP